LARLDEPTMLEGLDRLADNGAADFELLREHTLGRKKIRGPQLAGQNPLLDRIRNRLVKPAARFARSIERLYVRRRFVLRPRAGSRTRWSAPDHPYLAVVLSR
jgi:hypothetical protein